MSYLSSSPSSPMLRLLRRAALFLCICFPLWALYLLIFQLRSPYGERGQPGNLVTLQNVEQMLRENMVDQARHAEFREGSEAREERILKMRGVFEACISDLKKDGDSGDRWISMLARTVDLARMGGRDRDRESAEMEMRVAGAMVLGEISQRVARIENPPYEAFEANLIKFFFSCFFNIVISKINKVPNQKEKKIAKRSSYYFIPESILFIHVSFKV